MALCADRGFGADVFDGVWMWEDAVTAYLKEEKNPWYTECRSTRWKPGPAEKQELALSAIRPRHDEPHYTVDEALLFDEWVERIQRESMNVPLIVTADRSLAQGDEPSCIGCQMILYPPPSAYLTHLAGSYLDARNDVRPSRLLKNSAKWDRQIDPVVLRCSQH